MRLIGLAGLAVTAVCCLPATGAASSSKCKTKHEKTGCVLKQALYSNASFTASFTVSLGVGRASATGTATCGGSTTPQTAIFPGSLKLPIENPKVGSTYHKTTSFETQLNATDTSESTVTVTVVISSATRASVKFSGHTESHIAAQAGQPAAVNVCDSRASEKLKRVS